ncbi:MAG TPA: periplasmic heavy metal sensor [Chthoniobacterales bacterium]|nr:periplasmic heavy metal sensor [Chthoniobacterales bacterium]
MKRSASVLLLAIVASLTAYCVYYECATRSAQAMLTQPDGRMEWLRREFRLTDSQFTKVKHLHEAYRPGCDQMCLRIAAANSEADALISTNHGVTPEVDAALKKCAALQNECRQALLAHVYAVSAAMSPTEGQRYVRMMTARIVQPGLSHASVVSQEAQ